MQRAQKVFQSQYIGGDDIIVRFRFDGEHDKMNKAIVSFTVTQGKKRWSSYPDKLHCSPMNAWDSAESFRDALAFAAHFTDNEEWGYVATEEENE